MAAVTTKTATHTQKINSDGDIWVAPALFSAWESFYAITEQMSMGQNTDFFMTVSGRSLQAIS
jgi:hypothetical protein